jgi:hypothetical protein
MLAFQIPTKFSIPFASSASGGNIRTIPVTTADPTAASLTLGFPPDCFLPITAGGVPPNGADFNGIINQMTAWNQWQGAGSPAPAYDSVFSSAIGGYPAGAVLSNASIIGYFWISLVDSNTTDPDTGGAGWQSVSLAGTLTTGDVKFSIKTVADPGWVLMNDGTIGSASSGATVANAATQALFTLIYNNITDTWAPVLTSSGGATTRAAQGTAAVAWAANCRISLPKMLGRALAAAGAGSGLTSRALGQASGLETSTLITANLPPYTPSGTNAASVVTTALIPYFAATAGTYSAFSPSTSGQIGSASISGTAAGQSFTGTAQGGTSSPLSIVQPSLFLTAMIAL